MTNSSKNKFFLCFRPVVDIDVMLPTDPSVSHRDETPIPHNSTPPKPKLSRLIKSMVFETILNRRARRKNRRRRDSCESDRSYSTTYTEETSSTADDRSIWSQASVDITGIQEINPDSQYPSCQSESKFLCKSKTYPSEAKHRKRSTRDPLAKKRKKFDCSGIYLLLLSLTLTVFWGKILGVVLTSIWLYSYSAFRGRYLRLKTESKDCKNKNHRGIATRKCI